MYNPKLIDQVYYSGLSCRASRFYVIGMAANLYPSNYCQFASITQN